MSDATTTRDYDWWLLAIVAAICALGVLEIYSATHGSALAGMHMKQIRWLVIGHLWPFYWWGTGALERNGGFPSWENSSRCQNLSN